MQLKTKDEKTLRRYLLGNVSPEEQQEFELWLMSDEEGYDLLVATEDDLIDDSLRGTLQGDELERFNRYFLAPPERQRKLQFARSFKRYVVTSQEGPSRKPLYLWDAVTSFFRYNPAFKYAFSALIALMVTGSIWSAFRLVELRRQLQSATAQLADVSSQRDAYRHELDVRQSSNEQLQAQLQTLERTIAELKSPTAPDTLLAFNLMPGISRSSSSIPTTTITANTRLVRFSLTLLDDNYDNYRVVLVDDGGRGLWSADRLTASANDNGKAVVVSVPGELLSSRNYSFSLSGISNSQPPESISSFYFRAVRQ